MQVTDDAPGRNPIFDHPFNLLARFIDIAPEETLVLLNNFVGIQLQSSDVTNRINALDLASILIVWNKYKHTPTPSSEEPNTECTFLQILMQAHQNLQDTAHQTFKTANAKN